MNVVSIIHRILGETLLLIALIGVILAVVGLVRRRSLGRVESVFGLIYAGLLDLQALLGLVQLIWRLIVAGPAVLTPAVILHPFVMVLALAVVHGTRNRRNSPPPAGHRAQLLAYGLSLVLILIGYVIIT